MCGLFFFFGIVLGSFLNVCIYRIPKGTMLGSARSQCPSCDQVIAWFDNIPLLSFLLLRGKCRSCRSRISWRYPLVELVTGLMFVFLYQRFPFLGFDANHGGWWIQSFPDLYRFLHAALLSSFFVVISVIDLFHFRIPKYLCWVALGCLPAIVFIHPDLDWKSSVLGVVLGGGVIYLIAWTYFIVRKREGIGFGDVRLLAVIGGWLGYQAVIPVLLVSSITASVFGLGWMVFNVKARTMSLTLPFGPFLALGSWVELFFGNEVRMLLF